MTNINELIAQHCPNGVEFKELGEVVNFKRGTSITKSVTLKGNIPVIAGGRTPAYYHNESNRSGQTIVIAGSGAYAGYITYWEIPIFVSDAFTVQPNTEKLIIKFLYYYLLSKQELIHDSKSGGGVPHVYPKNLSYYKIPIPPLVVQEEIVRILDKFTALTSLTAELESELEARKKQYEFYRDKLLQGTMHNSQCTMELGEVCEVANNKRKPVESSKRIAGAIPYYGANNIQDYVDGFTHDGNYVLIAEDGTADIDNYSIQYTSGKFWANNHVHVISARYKLNDRFVYHYLTSFNFRPFLTGGERAKLTKENLLKIPIPIPPLVVQEEIVRILDKFTALTSLTAELESELEARKKQYEFYRDKLLQFTMHNV